uniref:Uncharacterized protein n=1 Tax=Rhizophora mucronata TaxID=61149 RepID=A0A2P2PNR8_RHIMU
MEANIFLKKKFQCHNSYSVFLHLFGNEDRQTSCFAYLFTNYDRQVM